MPIIQYANLGLRFMLELCILASLGYWGFSANAGFPFKLLLGIGAPLIAAVVWGTFLSPKASVPLPGAWPLLLEAVVFGLAIAALYVSGYPKMALVFACLAIVNRLLMWVWKQ